MTKGTKAFRIAICVLLALTMLWSGFWGAALISFAKNLVVGDEYGIWVAGVSVTRANQDDILGNGMVSYDPSNNVLVFNNALIEVDHAAIQSEIDLSIELIGENKFVCKNEDYIPAIYAADNYQNKDLSFEGEGSLTVEFQNVSSYMQGILADHLTIACDITINTNDCESIVNGIVCNSSLILTEGATVTVNHGAATHSAAVRVRGNVLLGEGTTLNIAVNPGTVKTCKGLSINGDLILGDNATLNVAIDEETAEIGECLRVTGFLDVGIGATVTASSKKVPALEGCGAVKLNPGAMVTATNAGQGADFLCYGALVNYGAVVNAEIEALGGIFNKAGN